ncbi:M43 family zinc metalloprotease [Brumimicrobium mesophilum]|uniref:M43 family zinc metalloprotease n=1 Tax=Brumimicrobium mesophilum TaxID=392717 RepID=UPI000D1402B6|nr:M43 family zinc metalloprotease [Brumimicrobium mesophilum]
MKKKLLFGFTLFAGISFAQQDVLEMERCYSHKFIEYQDQQTPGFIQHVNEQFEIAKNSPLTKSTWEYKIPVVVHVVHFSGAPEQNIHDSIILNQIDILNDDYNRWNEDTINMRSDFEEIAGSPKILFGLASIDPNGNPTTGITRTETSVSTFGDLAILTSGDLSAAEAVKNSSEGGIDPWDQSRYLNIWICNIDILGFTPLLGYATPPTNLPNWPAGSTGNLNDGVVLQFQAVGSNNPNDLLLGGAAHEVLGRTATHEVGHYLGLRHIWADGGCNQQDGIDDTPNAIEQSGECDTTANTCVDDINGIDLPDMVENYMDYSDESCQNSFTKGQVALMKGVLENQRYDLVYNNPASVSKNVLNASIYPNPTTNELNIQLDNGQIKTVEILNMHGQTLMQTEQNNAAAKINVSNLTPGVYIVKILNSNGLNTVNRFIKK